MALRSEVAKTDNSKLGRAVLNNRLGQAKTAQAANAKPVVLPKPVVAKKKTPTTKKVIKKTKA